MAHESWFTDERPPYDLDFLLAPPTLLAITAAVMAAVGWRLAARSLPRPELPFLSVVGRLSPWVPRLLAVHAGISLLAQAARGTYLAPSLELPTSAAGTLLAILEGVAGVWLITGFRIAPAAWLLVAAGPLGMPRYGLMAIMERVDLLGVGLFLALVPPSEDRGGAAVTSVGRLSRGMLALRLLVGGALVVLAFTEKLARPELALAFLDDYPAFNVLGAVGLSFGDLDFVRLAGAVELFFGLLIISGALPQLTVLLAGIPFNATLFFLGSSELIGHLPLYGAMLALLVYGSNRELAGLVSGLPGVKREADPALR